MEPSSFDRVPTHGRPRPVYEAHYTHLHLHGGIFRCVQLALPFSVTASPPPRPPNPFPFSLWLVHLARQV